MAVTAWEFEQEGGERRIARDLTLARLGLEDDLTIDLTAGGDFDDGCGGGFWCPACRAEARAEALAWLHDLSETYPMGPALHQG